MSAMTSSSLLYGKKATIQVGGLLIETGDGNGLDVEFRIQRRTKVTQAVQKPQANTCDLTILNLSPSHRKELEASTVPGKGTKVVPVVISAGYKGRQTVYFSGELRAAHSLTDGPTKVTQLTTGDGDKALTQQRLTMALAPGAAAEQALKAIVAALGVGPGNLKKGISLLSANPLSAQLFARGAVLKGPAADIMTDFCRAAGLDWSIQDGALQLTELGEPLQGAAVLLDSDHGLLESPTVDTKGILSCRTEMIPDMFPGRALSMNALDVKGGYRVLSVETRGQTDGNDWGHWIEAVRY